MPPADGERRVAAAAPELWDGLARLADRAPRLSDLRSHRIELFAAQRWRDLGRPVPDELLHDLRRSALTALAAPAVLARIRAACDGPLILFKGPEVAARYPDPAMRWFGDLDLLSHSPHAVHRALVGAGFELVGDPELYVDIHHLRPLLSPELPLAVEIHSRPKWVESLQPPSVDELFEAAVPTAVGVDGVLAPSPYHHALLLAAHSWAHEPLRRLRDVVDIAAVADGLDRSELERIARAWGIQRLWRTTIAAADAALADGPQPWAVRLWARNLHAVRERTVLESHLARWLSGFWALPPQRALRMLPSVVAEEIRPEPGESWQTKLARVGQAIGNALTRRSEHDLELEREGRQGTSRRR